jgi:hypothetical protein
MSHDVCGAPLVPLGSILAKCLFHGIFVLSSAKIRLCLADLHDLTPRGTSQCVPLHSHDVVWSFHPPPCLAHMGSSTLNKQYRLRCTDGPSSKSGVCQKWSGQTYIHTYKHVLPLCHLYSLPVTWRIQMRTFERYLFSCIILTTLHLREMN